MNMPWQRTTWDASIKANVALSMAVLILSVVAAYAILMTLNANDRERIVLTPPVVDKVMSVGWDSANEDYLKSFGLYTATLIGNINEKNAKFIADSISQFIAPEVYPDIRNTILVTSESRLFKEAAATTKFVPSGITYEPETRKVFVSGTMDLLATGQNSRSEPVTYEMVIRIVGGHPVIYQLTSYPDQSPRTQKWLADHQTVNTEEHK